MTSSRLNLWKKVEMLGAFAAALSGIAITLDLLISADRSAESSSFRLLLVLSTLPGVVFGLAAYLHAAKGKMWAMIVMFVAGSVNNALIICFGFGLVYLFALFQDTLGLIALIAGFLFVIISLFAAFIGWDPFRDDPQPAI